MEKSKFLIEYTHVEETTYKQWVEADSPEEALRKIEDETNFEDVVSVQGIEVKDYQIVEKK